ncbi:MAG: phosphate acyltransferase PlsX [Parachlamydiaceae bacterium]
MRIGIDLMGSDHSPLALFDGVVQAAKMFPAASFVLFVDKESASSLQDLLKPLQKFGGPLASIQFHIAEQVVSMHDDPMSAIRHKKKSSMILGIKELKRKALDAFITSGNTGALMASATLTLPLLPSVRRPGLLASLPTERAPLAVLDVGSYLLCKAEHLVNFAKIGSVYQRVYNKILKPRVALLNIGSESKKGTAEHQKAYQLLKEEAAKEEYEFLGNVEGREVFQGKVDVLVTDGFTGNVFLKTTEGVASFILEFLKKSSSAAPSTHLQHLIQELQSHFSYAEYPGAVLLGVDGIVIKCHGAASSKALFNAIKAAIVYVEGDLIEKIKHSLEI